jgi:hypothetical protein
MLGVTSVWNIFFLDEADDDDDPEYNFLEDQDEPDTEDFRTDRAVRITSESLFIMNPALVCSTSTFVYFIAFCEWSLQPVQDRTFTFLSFVYFYNSLKLDINLESYPLFICTSHSLVLNSYYLARILLGMPWWLRTRPLLMGIGLSLGAKRKSYTIEYRCWISWM